MCVALRPDLLRGYDIHTMKNEKAVITFIAVCMLSSGFFCFAAEPPSDPILQFETGMHGAMIRCVSTDAQGGYILTCSMDKTAKLWDRNGALLFTYRIPIAFGMDGRIFACGLSPDAGLVALGGWTGFSWDGVHSIYVLNRRTGEMVARLSGLHDVVSDIAFSGDGRYLACAFGGKRGIRVYKTTGWEELGRDTDYGDACYGISLFNQGGSVFLAACCDDGYLRLYSIGADLKLVGKVRTRGGKNPYSVSSSPDGRLLACGFYDVPKIDIYEVTGNGLKFLFAPDTKGIGIEGGNLCSVAFSADGRSLLAGGTWDVKGMNPLRQWMDAGRGKFLDIETPNWNSVLDIKPLPEGGFLYAAADPFWGIVSEEGKILFGKKAELADFRGMRQGFRVSANGARIAFGYGFFGAEPAVFDLDSGTLTVNGDSSGLRPPDQTSFPVTDWEGTSVPKLKGKALQLERNEISRSFAVLPDKSAFLIGTDWFLKLFDPSGTFIGKLPLRGESCAVNVSGDGKLILAALTDGTIRWYRVSDGRELAAFFPHADRKRWVLATSSGYYDCSPGGEDLVGWHVNRGKEAAADFYPASRFRAVFYRPDVVRLTLSLADEQAALAKANEGTGRQQAASVSTMLPPVIRILSPEQGARITADKVKIQYTVEVPAGETLKGVRVLVDGRPFEGSRGLSVTGKSGSAAIEVPVPGRDCTVSLIAETARASSEAAVLRLVWAGAKADEFAVKPKLYILAIGVSAYQNKEYRLRFAAKDAKDFAAALSAQKGGLYREVVVKTLTDEAATKDDIMDGLDWIQKETTSKDVAAVFLAGHGVNDPNGIYYYLPVNADTEKLKRTGVPFSDIKNTAQGLAGKVLFFVDTCHSGAVMGGRRGAGPDMTAVVNELSSAENGAVIFSSSTGSQYSLENADWGNGAFTKAVVEGLSGKADYTGAGRITVNMLDLYISERVKALTGGKQTPTTMKPPSVPDFPIAVK